ncbi:MAG: hemin ABC transporter substrate-binding protein [Methylophaga sp.]
MPVKHLLSLLMLLMLFSPAYGQTDRQTQRIVSVDSNATEILLALGLADQIVAADVTSQSLLSPSVPDLGYHRSLSAEGILQYHPDWVIGSEHMGPPETLALLEKASLKLIKLNSPSSPTQLAENVSTLGKLLGREQQAIRVVEKIEALQAHFPSASRQDHRMVFLLNLGDRGLSQAGKGTTADALIRLLGGTNISKFAGYQSVSIEALLAINPDVILLGQREDQVLDSEAIRQQYPLLSHTLAGQQSRIISVNAAELVAGLSLGALDEASLIINRLKNQP